MKKIIIIGIVLGSFWTSKLIAQDIAQVPYYMDFENQNSFYALDYWIIERDFPGGYNEIISDDSYDGSSSLKIWSDIAMGYGLTELVMDATIKLDLSEADMPLFEGYWKGVFYQENEESCYMGFSAFSDGANEGIFISDDDGQEYVKVYSFRSYGNWKSFKLNLRKLTDQYSLSFNDQFRIKIQYNCVFGTEPMSGCFFTKYLLIDNLSITEVFGNTGGGDDGHKVIYSYDKAGNRIDRFYEILLKSASNAAESKNISFKELHGEDEIIIYPNPTKGNLQIEIRGDSDEINYSYSLYGIKGNLLFNGDVNSYETFPLRMEHLNTGVYLLILKSSDEVSKYKIIKE